MCLHVLLTGTVAPRDKAEWLMEHSEAEKMGENQKARELV
jgi:hypothetical protein